MRESGCESRTMKYPLHIFLAESSFSEENGAGWRGKGKNNKASINKTLPLKQSVKD